jgi:hypothetical protein
MPRSNHSASHDFDVVARFLEHRASTERRDGAHIFYNDLAAKLDFPEVGEAWFAHPFCGIFGALDIEDVDAERPLRTALVISKKHMVPGDGFFKTLLRLRPKQKPPKDDIQRIQLWSDELDRLLEYYQRKA